MEKLDNFYRLVFYAEKRLRRFGYEGNDVTEDLVMDSLLEWQTSLSVEDLPATNTDGLDRRVISILNGKIINLLRSHSVSRRDKSDFDVNSIKAPDMNIDQQLDARQILNYVVNCVKERFKRSPDPQSQKLFRFFLNGVTKPADLVELTSLTKTEVSVSIRRLRRLITACREAMGSV